MFLHFAFAFAILVLGSLQLYSVGMESDRATLTSTVIGFLSGLFILFVGALFL